MSINPLLSMCLDVLIAEENPSHHILLETYSCLEQLLEGLNQECQVLTEINLSPNLALVRKAEELSVRYSNCGEHINLSSIWCYKQIAEEFGILRGRLEEVGIIFQYFETISRKINNLVGAVHDQQTKTTLMADLVSCLRDREMMEILGEHFSLQMIQQINNLLS